MKEVIRGGLILSLLFLVVVVQAQPAAGRGHVGLALSAVKMVGDESDASMISPWAQLSLGYAITDKIDLEVTGGFGWDRAFDTEESFPIKYFKRRPGSPYRTFQYPIMAHVRYHLRDQEMVSPYLTLGAGMLIWDLRDVSGVDKWFWGSRFGETVHDTQTNPLISLGAGLEWCITQQFGVDFSLRYQYLINQDVDMTGYGDVNTGNIEFRIAAKWFFGGSTDSDADGVLNRYDGCPKDPEDMDGFEDEDGCPDPDNDGDGIPDMHDKAPNAAEDVDGFEDADGVPDLDNDNDGIPDDRDAAPNIAEDIDGFEDEDGKPDPDNDQDGIPDEKDDCPNEPETVNGFEDDDGCPDEEMEVIISKEAGTVIQGVTFNTGSSELSLNAQSVLDGVFRTMEANPAMKMEVGGYSDSTGPLALNMRLSQARADAVKAYLVRQGINPTRIESKGYGPASPVATNSTAEGRAQNRRIEFIRTD
ncbi:OmpA family protein [candidate division KSB1 bacterium]|nr:OmpA family protein [candidate division KSB1 bacterium]